MNLVRKLQNTRLKFDSSAPHMVSVLATYAVSFFLILGRSPRISGSGLDPSWSAAVAEATARGMGFGKDLIFTYGPYSTLLTREFHPSIVHLAILSATLLSLSMGFFLNELRKRQKGHFWILLTLFLLLGPISYEYFLLSILTLSLIVLMTTFKPSLPTVIVLMPFAFFPLVKGSMAVGYFAFGGLFLFWLLTQRRFLIFGSVLVSQIVAVVAFWLFSGQKFSDLPAYARGLYELSNGYTIAMSIPGNFSEASISVLLFAFILIFIYVDVFFKKRSSWASALILGLFLFLAFKAGFVRHDGHALAFAYTVLVTPALWSTAINSSLRNSLRSLLAPIIVSSVLFSNHANFNPVTRIGQIYDQSSKTATQFLQPYAAIDNLEIQFEKSRFELAEKYGVDNFCEGASDIYPWETSALISSQDWDPRPVFQSYTVYTEHLRESNLDHLQSKPKGDRVIFSNSTIDGRLPLSMEPAAAYFFRSNYSIIGESSLGLCLEKTTNESKDSEIGLTEEATIKFEEQLEFQPNPESFTSIKIQLDRSAISKFFATLYRPSFVYVTLNFEDGESARYRFIPTDEPVFVPLVIGGREELGAFLRDEKPSTIVQSISLQQKGFPLASWDPDVLVSIAR